MLVETSSLPFPCVRVRAASLECLLQGNVTSGWQEGMLENADVETPVVIVYPGTRGVLSRHWLERFVFISTGNISVDLKERDKWRKECLKRARSKEETQKAGSP